MTNMKTSHTYSCYTNPQLGILMNIWELWLLHFCFSEARLPLWEKRLLARSGSKHDVGPSKVDSPPKKSETRSCPLFELEFAPFSQPSVPVKPYFQRLHSTFSSQYPPHVSQPFELKSTASTCPTHYFILSELTLCCSSSTIIVRNYTSSLNSTKNAPAYERHQASQPNTIGESTPLLSIQHETSVTHSVCHRPRSYDRVAACRNT